MPPLLTYLTELRDLRSTGATVKETSFYPCLARMLDSLGARMRPKVRCIVHLASTGAGIPDIGLFTQDQFPKRTDREPVAGQLPERGVVEAKPVAVDLDELATSDQVARYLARYGSVLVTNFREFGLVERDAKNRAHIVERQTLAGSAAEFWRALADPRELADRHENIVTEMLARALLTNAPVTQPRDVAWFLASYAREARDRIEHSSLAELDSLRSALEESLGVKFEDAKGTHFFQSTLIQTLFYGVFSAWVLWHRARGPVDPTDRFDWRTSAFSLQVPVIGGLFHQLSNPRRLKPLGLDIILDRTAAVLNRVDRAAFFGSFDAGDAVQYFYEPFLEAFDPELRKELGVWYTPREIVRYQVERVDRVLREELQIADGLADPSVYVLDPCCGTGAYLVEVLHRIGLTLTEKGGSSLLASDLKQAASGRVFGFELLPAPFVVAHLQVGLHLLQAGAAFADNERAGIYLTNTLTGWEPPDEAIKKRLQQLQLNFPELREERDAADAVKRGKRILVVLGNPPYNAYAGTAAEEEGGLVETYKGIYTDAMGRRRYRLNDPLARGGWNIRKFNLEELYARFFRIAERCIAEFNGTGVVCYISNFSYLAEPSFVIMRERLLASFDKIWIDCLNGDSRSTGKLTPDGNPDPSVFSTEYNREGIKKGTAICTFVRRRDHREGIAPVLYRDFWGTNKRAELLDSLSRPSRGPAYVAADPTRENRLLFVPAKVSAEYRSWPNLLELALKPPYNGPVERRGNALISLQRDPLVERMRAYFDASVSNEEVGALHPSLMMTGNRIEGPKARAKIQQEHTFDEARIVRYPVKPLDTRWCYLENLRPLFSEPSPDLLAMRNIGVPQGFLISRDTADKDPEGPPFYFSRFVCDYDCISGHARHFPLWIRNGTLKRKVDRQTMWLLQEPESNEDNRTLANLSPSARAWLLALGLPDPDLRGNEGIAALAWMHALALGFSPAYLDENRDGVRQGWPRVPLPNTAGLLEESAALGWQIAALLDTEKAVAGVTAGPLRAELRAVGVLTKRNADGEFATHAQIDPAKDLEVTAGWGQMQAGGIVMPGSGATVEQTHEKPTPWAATVDVFLNDNVAWRGIPKEAWEFHLGGYQVLKKWLSYRERGTPEKPVLGRALSKEEARTFTALSCRLAALALLRPALDANYRAMAAAAIPLPTVQNAPNR